MRYILKDNTVKSARSKKSVYRLNDGEGLFLLINKLTSDKAGTKTIDQRQGSKVWQYRYRIHGKAKTFPLGKYPTTDLKTARARHLAASKLVEKDICPIEDKEKQIIIEAEKVAEKKSAEKVAYKFSFEGVARKWYADSKKDWKNKKHRDAVIKTLELYVFPVVGRLHVAEISKPEIWQVIKVLKDRGIYETAARVLMRINAVFDYAIIIEGLMKENPCTGIAKYIRKPEHMQDRHYPALEPKQMPVFLADYAKRSHEPKTRIAARLLLLTAVRTSELIEARWSEIDFTNKVWTIPAARMKKSRVHVVPLSQQAIEAFEEARLYSRQSKLVFPSRSSAIKPMSNNTILYSIQRTKDEDGNEYRGRMTGHGMRSVFSTYMNSLKDSKGRRVFESDDIELQLAHVSGDKVKAAYDHNKHLDTRAIIMDTWADTCDRWSGITSNVVAIKTG